MAQTYKNQPPSGFKFEEKDMSATMMCAWGNRLTSERKKERKVGFDIPWNGND